MQSVKLNDRQSRELTDEIDNLLANQLDSDLIRNKDNRIASDFVKRNNLNIDAANFEKHFVVS
jgi:hypothetical protein